MPVMNGSVSLVRACQDFFSKDGGTKVSIKEFRALEDKDKLDLVEYLKAEGYSITPVKTA